jgi:hypothetical protein
MAKLHLSLVQAASWLVGVCALAACSSNGPPPERASGEVALALVAHTADHTYRLHDATFDITRSGDAVASLSSESDPEAEQLKRRLDPGDYRLQLLDDWFLTRADPGTSEVPVDAFLESPMSGAADFQISDGVTTTVPYTFVTDGVPIGFGTGEVAVAIVVHEQLSTTRLDLATSASSISTELGTTTDIDLTLTASDGFSGLVGLSGSLLDAEGNPMTGWSLSVEPTMLDVPLDGVAIASARLTIPVQNRGLAATARFVASSAAGVGTHSADVSVTALNQYTIGLAVSQGQCVYPPAGTLSLTQGTKLRWLNLGSEDWSIHTNGFAGTCPHQVNTTPAGGSYDCSLTAVTSGSWYCHSPGPQLPGLNVQVVEP